MGKISDNIVPWVIVIIFGMICAYAAWELKPGPTEIIRHDTLMTKPDTVRLINPAIEGMIYGTDRQLAERYGRRIWTYDIRDSLRIKDSTVIDTHKFYIKTLESEDSLRYSGFDLYNEDTLKVGLKVKVQTLALLEPVNAIQNTITIDSIKVTVPPQPEPSLLELTVLYWKWLIGIFGIGYLAGS